MMNKLLITIFLVIGSLLFGFLFKEKPVEHDDLLGATASVATLGTGSATTSGSTIVITTSAQLDAGNIGIVVTSHNSADNTNDSETNDVSSVTDSAGNTYTKLIGLNNNGSGVAGDPAVYGSVWFTKATSTLASGGTITVTLAGDRLGRAASAWEYTVDSGNTLQIASGGSVSQELNAADPASLALSSLPSKEYLFFRHSGVNGRDGTFTGTTDYTKLSVAVANTGGGAASRQTVSEFIIATATGHTSNPSGVTVTGVEFLLALEEVAVGGGAVGPNLDDFIIIND